ncbi:unnamed protein product [Periconia digitata]|uniref:RING-type domain-containing protein n=1 Tax=Periconia digitata TaxID=1303443 RepID=A0A9W4UHY8_9PLEO|nr:unnamed protein product [Periconia digitata]
MRAQAKSKTIHYILPQPQQQEPLFHLYLTLTSLDSFTVLAIRLSGNSIPHFVLHMVPTASQLPAKKRKQPTMANVGRHLTVDEPPHGQPSPAVGQPSVSQQASELNQNFEPETQPSELGEHMQLLKCEYCDDDISPDLVGHADLCKYFRRTCTGCFVNMVRAKIHNGNLEESGEACPHSCGFVISFAQLQQVLPRTTFVQLDNALLNHHLRSSDSYMDCNKCGKAFSIEGYGAGQSSLQSNMKIKATCPDPRCSHEHCFSCRRQWHGHTACNTIKTSEEMETEKMLKKMGAKPCPSCGIFIRKKGGCDHMHCSKCRTHFSWHTLAIFPGTARR